MAVEKDVFRVHVTDPPPVVTPTAALNTTGSANVVTDKPSRVGLRNALDLPEQDDEPEGPYIAFLTARVTYDDQLIPELKHRLL